ncbi:MAG TPA: sensor histidine kinase [Acidimicrobiales bacterium]|nr:sensor histidine kinase [Acidimicrobiales bacterium]
MGAQGHGPRWSRSQWSDVALAAAALAISASVLPTRRFGTLEPLAWSLVLVHAVPVAFRRRSPRAAFAVSAAAGTFYVALGWPMVGLGLAALIMVYSLAAYAPRRHSLVGLAAVELVLLASAVVGTDHPQIDTLLGNLLVVTAAWVLGDGARRRREDAVSEQRRLAHRAVAEERLRIARELHDVVAHSMSVIAVQAGTGRLVIDDDPEHARRALTSIEETSKEALAEMRRLLGVLREDTPDVAALAPVPTLDDLDRLVAHAVEGGTPVDVQVDGDRRGTPAGIELAAYRVLQEALTNVRRHAPGARARVRLTFDAEELVVAVENPLADGDRAGDRAPNQVDQKGGHGLIGMRERVTVYGGAFQAGPRPDGTFRVTARIPYRPGDGEP